MRGTHLALMVLLALMPGGAAAQDRVERVVIVMRHGVRSAMSTPAELGRYSRRPWPHFAVPPGHLTDRGAHLATLLGDWYRARYAAAGLLARDACAVHYHANRTERTEATATAFAAGLSPGCGARIDLAPAAPDPLFEAPVASDPPRLLAAVAGRIGSDLARWDRAHRADLDVFEALILQCRALPCTRRDRDRARVERRLGDTPVAMRIDPAGRLDLDSPALRVAGIAESLVMAYADGLDFAAAGWRGVDAAAITRALAVHAAGIDLRTRTPEIGRQAIGHLAQRLLATLRHDPGVPATTPAAATAIGGDAAIVVLVGHDTNVTMLAGLLGLDWILPSYGAGEAAPGGALVFERWRRARDGEPIVRVHYIAQGLDQLRRQTVLANGVDPERAALFVPGCSDADMACPLSLLAARIDALSAPTTSPVHPVSPRKEP